VNILARIVSLVFHPLLMATYLFLLLSLTLPSALDPIQAGAHYGFILLIFLITFVLPAANVLAFRMMGSIKTLTMYDRRERLGPFFFISVLYLVVTYFFYSNYRIGLHDTVFKLIVIIDALVILSTLITIFYKVSVHTVGLWGLLGIILPLNKITENDQLLIPTILLILVAGVVMSSRLLLNAHKPREVMIGSLVGFSTGLLGILFLF
jgi:membrane-associated phospholipid phosphatase